MKRNLFFLLFLIFFFVSFVSNVSADTKSELEAKIEAQKQKIADLDKQIEKSRATVEKIATEAKTLQNLVNELNASEKNISTKIQKTEGQINATQLTIEKINLEIGDKEQQINSHKGAIAQALRESRQLEQTSLIEILLDSNQISHLFNAMDEHEKVRETLFTAIENLQQDKVDLAKSQTDKENEKKNLKGLSTTLSSQKEAVAETKKEKNTLLVQTKNSEAAYQKILAEKMAAKKQYEDALLQFESQLKTVVNSDSITKAARGVIGWPLEVIRITQLFGGTQFAKNNPGIYARAFHNGVDFGTPLGSNVYSVADGVIVGSGNTDAYAGCYSWGKWILVRHSKLGLVSLYGHLSSISVSPGQEVTRGEVIGLSGSTGISTGPHLHLTILSDQGVELRYIHDFYPATKCGDSKIPVAPLDAYLDPMRYLPQ